jgi:small subunit ribosomal protein S7
MAKKYLSVQKKTLYNKLLGVLTKQGNKTAAAKIINAAFLKVSKSTTLSMNKILLKLFLKLNSFIEVKKVRVKRSFHLVPFQITLKRRSYLIIKWLMQVIKTDSRNISISDKLAFEIDHTLKSENSKLLNLQTLNTTLALANRSNIHYRW